MIMGNLWKVAVMRKKIEEGDKVGMRLITIKVRDMLSK